MATEATYSTRNTVDNQSARAMTAFSFIWAATELFHLITFDTWTPSPAGAALFCAAASLALRPSSIGRLALVNALDVIYYFDQAPLTANHILFNAIVNLTMLLVIVRWFLKKRSGQPFDRTAAFNEIRDLGRLCLIILYFFTVFHKLNWDYLNPDVSCGAHLLLTMNERFPFLPTNQTAQIVAIWGTLAIEVMIPFMLCIRRLRKYGLALGVGLHMFLGIHPHLGLFSFSALMFALFFLFLPDGFLTQFEHKLSKFPRLQSLAKAVLSRSRWAIRIVLVALVTGIAVFLALRAFDIDARYLKAYITPIGLLVWLIWGGGLGLFYLFTDWGTKMEEHGLKAILRPHFTPLLIMPALLIVHSFNPYLGLKTVPCLSMFSNLRTEGGRSNHLLVPASLQIANYQKDLVNVFESSEPLLQRLASSNRVIPYFEFRRLATSNRASITIDYARNGVRVTYQRTNAGNIEGETIKPVPWLLGKYLRFRPINMDGPMQCCW